jgi:hypothetical protein
MSGKQGESRAGVGAVIRDLVKTIAHTERSFSVFETQGAIMLPRSEPAAAPETPRAEPRRAGRLIDLERRAKFGRFDSSRR